MKIRNGFVSNSSSSSFIITDYHYSEISIYTISIGSEAGASAEEIELWDKISAECGEHPGQGDETPITTNDIPEVWKEYEYNKIMADNLIAKIPLDMSLMDIIEIYKNHSEKEKEDES